MDPDKPAYSLSTSHIRKPANQPLGTRTLAAGSCAVSQKRKPSRTIGSRPKRHQPVDVFGPQTTSATSLTIEPVAQSVLQSAEDSGSASPLTPVASTFSRLGLESAAELTSSGTATKDPVESDESRPTTPSLCSAEPAQLSAPKLAAYSTPIRRSTSFNDARPINPSDSTSLRNTKASRGDKKESKRRQEHMSSQASLDSDASNNSTSLSQNTIEAILKNELHGSVFLYEAFWDDFLPVDEDTMLKVQTKVDSQVLKLEDDLWSFDHKPFTLGSEPLMYEPLVDVLDTIGRATHQVAGADEFRPYYRSFSDQHSNPAAADYPTDTRTKPDIVKAQRRDQRGAHWGDVELVVECKKDTLRQSEAYLQLARYARAIFSHQFYRLHVFCVAVCGPAVTFVRFDRSGLLHSPTLDITEPKDAHEFVRRMISLLTLPAAEFGYDTRYSFRRDPTKHHVDVLFRLDERDPPRAVDRLLCHRKCCRGRATLASCLAPVDPQDMPSSCGSAGDTTVDSIDDAPPSTESLLGSDDFPDQPGDYLNEEIVHKSIWRDSRRTPEGVTLKRFQGVFGVCQLIDHRDNVYSTRVKYPSRLKQSPAASLFVPTELPASNTRASTSTQPSSVSNVSAVSSNQTSNTTDTDLDTSTTDASHPEVSASSSDTSEEAQDRDSRNDVPKPPLREVREKSDTLMPKGMSLFEARNPAHLLRALHDALLGIAAFAEAGMLHCDISVYNILLVDPEVHYRQSGGWMSAVPGSLGNLVWNSLASEMLPPRQDNEPEVAPANDEKSYREEYLGRLNRGPEGVVSDVEFSVEEQRNEDEVNSDRTGTPAFISAQLLESATSDQLPVARAIIHDLESLLWVLIWIVIHHEPRAMNQAAKDLAQSLSEPNLRKLYRFKSDTIALYGSLEHKIRELNNGWSDDLAAVIEELGSFVYHFLYFKDLAGGVARRDAAKEFHRQEHRRLMNLTRWEVFEEFLGIFDHWTRELSEKYEGEKKEPQLPTS
ncbi:hypothetical protein RhiJN_25996 [Ceratobasidium sp. AG-Ba]|nr:hypothetical protein RhiJN_25996 [Ceratobasidium sp. AG-Ba]